MMEKCMTPDPREPFDEPPKPVPIWPPEPPVDEPEPDRLPDEVPLPNPDETNEPPIYVPPANMA
jgi:hypothetical protein